MWWLKVVMIVCGWLAVAVVAANAFGIGVVIAFILGAIYATWSQERDERAQYMQSLDPAARGTVERWKRLGLGWRHSRNFIKPRPR